jgi:hypothetical protein
MQPHNLLSESRLCFGDSRIGNSGSRVFSLGQIMNTYALLFGTTVLTPEEVTGKRVL